MNCVYMPLQKGYKGQKCDKSKKKVIKSEIKRETRTHGQNNISNRIWNGISLATRQKLFGGKKTRILSAGLT